MSASYPAQRSFEVTTENALPSLLHPFARHHARLRERAHHVNEQRLAWRVQDVLAGCGLIQVDYSMACGRVVHIPEVVSVVTGPTSRLKIRILPGQMPEDFAAKAGYDMKNEESHHLMFRLSRRYRQDGKGV